jgi:hypothetical protein
MIQNGGMYDITYLSKPIYLYKTKSEFCISGGLWLVVMVNPGSSIVTDVPNFNDREPANGGEGGAYGDFLNFLLNFSVNLKLL